MPKFRNEDFTHKFYDLLTDISEDEFEEQWYASITDLDKHE